MATTLRQSPFEFRRNAKGVSDPQLTYAELLNELKTLSTAELVMYVRTYVQERTPAAFSTQPMLWEAVREWVATRLQVHPREFGLSGSGQSGFSVFKGGAPFNPLGSDLDMFIVNEVYFSKVEVEARKFSARNAENSKFTAQASTVSRQVQSGYLDLNQVPAVHEQYPHISAARNDASIVIDRLRLHGFQLKASHFRIYKNWRELGNWVRRSYSSLTPTPVPTSTSIPLRPPAEPRP